MKKKIVFCIILLIVIIVAAIISVTFFKNVTSKNDLAEYVVNPLVSIDKVVLYSSAYGESHDETQARWNIDISQYTDMAIYLNTQTDITISHIDNINFSNFNSNLSLSYLEPEKFGKLSNEDLKVQSNDNLLINIGSTNNPITLRYLNYNLKENYLITDIENPLSFDGSILKRGKVTLSSLKNTISFTIHVKDSENKNFHYNMTIPIVLENKETNKSIYDGVYTDEISFSNDYFYTAK